MTRKRKDVVRIARPSDLMSRCLILKVLKTLLYSQKRPRAIRMRNAKLIDHFVSTCPYRPLFNVLQQDKNETSPFTIMTIISKTLIFNQM